MIEINEIDIANHKSIWTINPYTKNLPHENCNWILHNVLIGAAPTSNTLTSLLSIKCTCFVNLCDNTEYVNSLPSDVIYLNCLIDVGTCPKTNTSKNECDELIKKILEIRKNNIVYIHCYGGNGRTGMIAAILYGLVCGTRTCESIEAIENSRKTRRNQSLSFVPTPETNEQVLYVANILGIELNRSLPDRTDQTWKHQL
jgi:hypothetical protein